MRVTLNDLPRDVEVLHRLVRDMAGAMDESRAEIERLRLIVKQFQHAQFGRSSERLDPDQLQLGLEDLDFRPRPRRRAAAGASPDASAAGEAGSKPPHRRPRPEHLPRSEAVLDVSDKTCQCCGGALHAAGETASEMRDWVPAQVRVLRVRRPKWACQACGTRWRFH